jgi:putative glutamine amidotransferase
MTPQRPKIGITGTDPAKLQDYREVVEAAGGDPVPLLPESARSAEEALRGLDGVVLSGGVDIDPGAYGQARQEGMDLDVDLARDGFELPLARAAIARDLPVLGVCRGIQTLNVVMGGTLYQDIVLAGLPQNSHQQRKFTPPPPEDKAVHQVTIESQSLLREVVGTDRLGVNTFHHQAIDRVARGFIVTARSVEPNGPGLIEAIEAPRRRFVMGVQWHPERMWRREPACARLFQALIRAAVRMQSG